jgi:hypothetical protein
LRQLLKINFHLFAPNTQEWSPTGKARGYWAESAEAYPPTHKVSGSYPLCILPQPRVMGVCVGG